MSFIVKIFNSVLFFKHTRIIVKIPPNGMVVGIVQYSSTKYLPADSYKTAR